MKNMSSEPEGTLSNTRRNFLAIAAMIASTFFFLVGDSLVKLITEELPVPQTIFLRGLITSALVFAAVCYSGLLPHLHRLFDKAVLIRSSTEGLTTLLIVTALTHMAIADATAVINSVPLVATAMAVVFLREKVSLRGWAALLVGFAGVILVLRPNNEQFNIFSLFAVAATVSISIREIVTRRISSDIPSLILTFGSAIVVCLTGILAILVTREWESLTPQLMMMVCAASITLFGAYHFAVISIRLGEISLTAPFRYTVILWGILIGYVVWGDVPDFTALAGMLLITLAGLYVVNNERNKARSQKLCATKQP
jgi:drug/metabolite transporter (DMT)-like permease